MLETIVVGLATAVVLGFLWIACRSRSSTDRERLKRLTDEWETFGTGCDATNPEAARGIRKCKDDLRAVIDYDVDADH